MAEEKKVKIDDKDVTIYATSKAKHMTAGQAYQVNSIVAETLIKKGKATKQEPKKASK